MFGGLVNGEGYSMLKAKHIDGALRQEAMQERAAWAASNEPAGRAPKGKRTPTGFVAVCQCGKAVGALDLERSDRGDASRLLGTWLMAGCTVHPQFTYRWAACVEPCACSDPPNGPS
jgi:hypothetical protein